MTIEELCRRVRGWDTGIVYHELSFNGIGHEINWKVEQWLMQPDNHPERWRYPLQVAAGIGTASLVRFVKTTDAGDRCLRLDRYEVRGVTLRHQMLDR